MYPWVESEQQCQGLGVDIAGSVLFLFPGICNTCAGHTHLSKPGRGGALLQLRGS